VARGRSPLMRFYRTLRTQSTIPRARALLIEDLRNGGDPRKAHGVCEVKLCKGRIIYEGMRLCLSDLRRMSRREWRSKCPAPAIFITGKDKGKLGYFCEHVFLKAKSGPNLFGVVNPDTGAAILDSEQRHRELQKSPTGCRGT